MPQRSKMSLKIESLPDTAIATSSATTIGAGFAGLLSWLGQINWVGLISVLVAVTGLAANIYFQIKRDKREKSLHEFTLKIQRNDDE